MKYICLGALSTVLAFTSASGQCRIGYINLHKLIMLIPENKEMEDSVSLLKERLNDNFQDLLNEYIGKIKEFDKQWGEMSERIPTINPEDITRIQNKILEQKYQDSLMLVSTEKTLLAPILDKAKKVLKAVANEKGYTLVIDNSKDAVLVSAETDDLMPAVKVKMGLK